MGSALYTYSKGESYQHERDGHVDAKRGESLDATTKKAPCQDTNVDDQDTESCD